MKFTSDIRRTPSRTAFGMMELVFHSAVHNVRKGHGSPVLSLLLAILQTVMMVISFYVMFNFIGARRNSIRGDYILYLMSGIFMFTTHIQAIAAVMKADGPTSSMMKHGPMTTIVAIASSALSALYLQIFGGAIVIYFYHALAGPITIDKPVGMLAMLLLSWAAGVGIGLVFRSASPWNPRVVGIISTFYRRLNMIASGKMFVANATPTAVLKLFDWNPLFHTIDQGRGFIFLNYNPHYSNITYPIIFTGVCFTIGLMGEFFTKSQVSLSWTAGK